MPGWAAGESTTFVRRQKQELGESMPRAFTMFPVGEAKKARDSSLGLIICSRVISSGPVPGLKVIQGQVRELGKGVWRYILGAVDLHTKDMFLSGFA